MEVSKTSLKRWHTILFLLRKESTNQAYISHQFQLAFPRVMSIFSNFKIDLNRFKSMSSNLILIENLFQEKYQKVILIFIILLLFSNSFLLFHAMFVYSHFWQWIIFPHIQNDQLNQSKKYRAYKIDFLSPVWIENWWIKKIGIITSSLFALFENVHLGLYTYCT